MDTDLSRLAVHALYLVLLLSAPGLIASLLAGVLIAWVQSVTHLGDQALAHLPKLLAVGLVLAVTGSWIGGHLVRFTAGLWESIPQLVK